MTSEPTAASPHDDDPILRQLMNQAREISQLRRDLDSLAHEATDSVAGLQSRIEDLQQEATTSSGVSTSWCWRTIGPHGAEELWRQLTDWVNWIRSRYPLARKIPPCWTEHPELVEELTALYVAWQHAYEDLEAPLTAAADWHDRWLPGVLHRLEHGAFALDCTEHHRPRPNNFYAETTDGQVPGSGVTLRDPGGWVRR